MLLMIHSFMQIKLTYFSETLVAACRLRKTRKPLLLGKHWKRRPGPMQSSLTPRLCQFEPNN